MNTIFDYESPFDMICSIFQKEISAKGLPSKIIDKEVGKDEDVPFMVISSHHYTNPISSIVYYIKEKKEYGFRSYFYFHHNIKSDEGVQNVADLVRAVLDAQHAEESDDIDRTSVSEIKLQTKYDFSYPDDPAFEVIVEFITPPPSFHFADGGYKLFDLWKGFDKYVQDFYLKLVDLDLDRDFDSQVFNNYKTIEKLCRVT